MPLVGVEGVTTLPGETRGVSVAITVPLVLAAAPDPSPSVPPSRFPAASLQKQKPPYSCLGLVLRHGVITLGCCISVLGQWYSGVLFHSYRGILSSRDVREGLQGSSHERERQVGGDLPLFTATTAVAGTERGGACHRSWRLAWPSKSCPTIAGSLGQPVALCSAGEVGGSFSPIPLTYRS